MKLVPIDRYWHSHEYQMSSLALVPQWWIPAELIIEWPSNESAGHISSSNSFSSNLKLNHLFHVLFVKWTQKIGGGKKELAERWEAGMSHTTGTLTALMFWHKFYTVHLVVWFWSVKGLSKIFYTFPNKVICLIIKRELGCLLAKGKD